MSAASARRAVFLDRDGTLIEDVGYPSDPETVRFIDGAVDALAELQRRRFTLVVVSNQSGIGRGLITQEQADAVHARFVDELRDRGIALDDVRYCPHAPSESCSCRKPAAGLLTAAAAELGVDLARSFMVGDSEADVGAGRAAGCRTIVLGATAKTDADFAAAAWPEALAHILNGRE